MHEERERKKKVERWRGRGLWRGSEVAKLRIGGGSFPGEFPGEFPAVG